jgi:hypothetical protein
VNFLGHTFVAMAQGDDDPEYLLGAVLPDLASMARVRIDRSALDGVLLRGVRCHIEVDAAFHAHPDFRSGMAAIRAGLVDHDVGRGAARAIGHVGWELLLDGTLVGSATETAYWRALEVAPSALKAITPSGQDRWARFLGLWDLSLRPQLRYDDPGWVADRLYAMLSDRPHLSFPEAHVPAVAQVLEDEMPAVAAVADGILTSLR